MRDAKFEKWLKQAVLKKDCEALTPSFKVRILITSEASNKVLNACVQVLIPLPRENRHPHVCLFFSSIEEDKDSKNRYYEQSE